MIRCFLLVVVAGALFVAGELARPELGAPAAGAGVGHWRAELEP